MSDAERAERKGYGVPLLIRAGCWLLGVVAFLLKRSYRGPMADWVHAQGGNFAVSFALYFVAVIAASRFGRGRLAAALAVLLVVEAFEITNGFGLMANVYDPIDLLANAAGIAAALLVDLAARRPPASASAA